jgi:hypothetical protein
MIVQLIDEVIFQRVLAPFRGGQGMLGRLVWRWDLYILRRMVKGLR